MITMRQFSAGEVVIKEHEPGETAFVIEKGKVVVSKEQNGKIVQIALLETGATFGEMSMVDDMPRSATVTAVEATLVREIHRDDLYANMKANPEAIVNILKNIFERLRDANMLNAQLQSAILDMGSKSSIVVAAAASPLSKASVTPLASHPIQSVNYCFEGMTPQAIEAIANNPVHFKMFPFKIGRKTRDPIVNNDLEIHDQAPLQVSRHHVSLIKDGDRIGVLDRGSQLGASVDGVRIGDKHAPGPVFFKGSEGLLVLGTSPTQRSTGSRRT